MIKPHDPRKAEVGKLYELRFNPVEIDAEELCFYVFDTAGKLTNKTWSPGRDNFCLVLDQHHKYTVVLVGEEIIHVADDDSNWKIELIPLVESSNQHGS